MIYLDNSATTKVNDEVLNIVSNDLFTKISEKDLEPYKEDIKKLLGTDLDVIITSGSTESNNLAIKGVCDNYSKGEIIATHLEHSSVNSCLDYFKSKGFEIKYIPIKDSILDLEALDKMINSNTLLISVCLVNSELGMLNDINKIGEIAHKHNALFHSDFTQAVGKVPIDLSNVDLASISSHKFHGPKGIGILLKNRSVQLKPVIYGERSYNLGLIKGMIKALEISLSDLNNNYEKVKSLKSYLIERLNAIPHISINESINNIPHIVNFSVLNYKPETFLHYLEMYDIYISTKSACSSGDYSEAVLDLTKDMKKAETSVRISLSEDVTMKDLDKVIDIIKRREHGK